MEHVHALAVTVGGVTPPLLSSLATVETCSAIATRLARLSLVVPTLVDEEQSGQANVCVLSQDTFFQNELGEINTKHAISPTFNTSEHSMNALPQKRLRPSMFFGKRD